MCSPSLTDTTTTGDSVKTWPEMWNGFAKGSRSTATSTDSRVTTGSILGAERDQSVDQRRPQDGGGAEHQQDAPQLGEPAALAPPDDPGVPQRQPEKPEEGERAGHLQQQDEPVVGAMRLEILDTRDDHRPADQHQQHDQGEGADRARR